MVNANPLASLRDIHLPQPITWWPPAIGWYLLFFLGLLMLAVFFWRLSVYYNSRRAKREALRLLKVYYEEYQNNKNPRKISMNVDEVLKRVALAYFPREEVAGLHGQPWVDFLSKHSNNMSFDAVRDALVDLPYQKKDIMMDLEPLFKVARAWIKQRGACRV